MKKANYHRQFSMNGEVQGQIIKFNALKHHFQFLKMTMAQWITLDWEQVCIQLLELGENQFDIYTGNLTPSGITRDIQRQLEMNKITTRDDLQRFLGTSGYKSLTLEDGSRWIIRESETGPGFVHLHPGRCQSLVRRIRSAHLKTAIALCYESKGELSPETEFTTAQINKIRTVRLGLSPIKSIEDSRKITETLRFLTGHS